MRGILLVSVAAVLWGTTGVANSLMSAGSRIDPALVGLSRTMLGALSLLVVAVAIGVPPARGVPLGLIAVFGIAGAVFQTCLFTAFDIVGVTVTVAVTVCAPVVLVTAGDALWSRRAPEPGVAAGILVAAGGVLLAMFGDRGRADGVPDFDAQGAALLAAASVAFAVVAVCARVMARGLHPVRITGLGLAATAGALALVVLVRGPLPRELVALPARDLAILAYIGVAATGVAYLAFVLGMHLARTAPAGLAATLIEPGVAALLAALVLRERLTLPETSGCFLMISAMVLLFLAERRAAVSARQSGRTP